MPYTFCLFFHCRCFSLSSEKTDAFTLLNGGLILVWFIWSSRLDSADTDGLREPLQAYKSQHPACGSGDGVNKAVVDTLLTSGPFFLTSQVLSLVVSYKQV